MAEEGSLSGAARRLHLTHSTLSTQLRQLEQSLGGPLFERRGRRLVLTSFGDEVRSYAADIVRLGDELLDVANGRGAPGRRVLRVGVVSTLPKTLTFRLLEPAVEALGRGRLVVRQDALGRLVHSLAAGRLDLVLADEVPADVASGIHAHVLGETEIMIYGTPALASAYRRGFPRSLASAPFVLPTAGTTLRRRIEQWFVECDLSVRVEVEVDDAALLRIYGAEGRGLFPVRAAVQKEIEDLHGVQRVGVCEGLRERYFALSIERRVRHPAVAALIGAARASLHTPRPGRPRST